MLFTYKCDSRLLWIRWSLSTLTTSSYSPPVWLILHHEFLNYLSQSKPVSLKCLSNLDLKMSIVSELPTDAGRLFQWTITLTLVYDLRAIVLYFCTFNFIPLPLVSNALFISKNTSGMILSILFTILLRERERDRERKRGRPRESKRETERRRDGETERRRDGETERETERETTSFPVGNMPKSNAY